MLGPYVHCAVQTQDPMCFFNGSKGSKGSGGGGGGRETKTKHAPDADNPPPDETNGIICVVTQLAWGILRACVLAGTRLLLTATKEWHGQRRVDFLPP